MIPKIAHFYWGQEILPYLRYLTIKSFCRYNPDWKVNYYIPKHRSTIKPWATHEHKYEIRGQDYSSNLKELPISIVEIDFTDNIGIDNTLPEVHKSDFLRWHILATVGGLWSDMDILYFKPMNLDLYWNTYICKNPDYGHSIGFLLACEKNPIYKIAFNTALENYYPNNYQTVGSIIMNKIDTQIYKLDPMVQHVQNDIVYAYDAIHIKEIFSSFSGPTRFTRSSIGIHWYAGHGLAGDFQNGKIGSCLLKDILKREGYNADF